MKYFSAVATYQFSWDQVAAGYWLRYPNPFSKHVLTEDTVQRTVSSDRQLYSTRVITKTNKLPKWGERFVPKSTRSTCIVEESVVDPTNKTFTTYTRNIGLSSIMTVDEKCVYKPDPGNNTVTICQREAWINSNLFGFSYAIQAFGHERFKSNAGKAVKGFEYVLNKLYMPDTIPVDNTLQLNLNKETIKSTAKLAKDVVKEKAKERVTAVATYASGTTTG